MARRIAEFTILGSIEFDDDKINDLTDQAHDAIMDSFSFGPNMRSGDASIDFIEVSRKRISVK